MKTVGDLITAVKRFVANNSNSVDVYQNANPNVTYDEFITAACLTAVNNARLFAEKNASFSWLETTVSAFFPVGMGINLNRLYPDDGNYEAVSGASVSIEYRFDRLGILYLRIPTTCAVWQTRSADDLQSLILGANSVLAAGEYTVWDKLAPTPGWYTFKMAHKDSTVTAATTWAALTVAVSTCAFNTILRLNTVLAANVISDQGGRYPLDLDSRQSEHIKLTNQMGKATSFWNYPAISGLGLTTEQPKALFVGRELKLNFTATTQIDVELAAIPWMPAYTCEHDTDYLIENGFDFMMWRSIVELNYITQVYVSRADGVLAPPDRASDEAWGSLMVNDAFANSSFYHQ